ncbi:MAG: FHA domain-containing protein [Alphaproteobacteria bacterium]|nr:FHA domain-containing protein [Alphaproteobacteria bacterium]
MKASQNQLRTRILRIGVAAGGKIVDERLVPAGEGVTIGSDPGNTISLPDVGLPRKHVLFAPERGGAYRLQPLPDMDGKIAHGDAIVPVGQLTADGEAVQLSERDRGKLVIGTATVLFQFVTPPPELLDPVRSDFRPRLFDEEDPVFYGFLGVFSALAAVFMIFVANAEPREEIALAELPERFVQLQLPSEPEPVEALELPTDPDAPGETVDRAEEPEPTDGEPQEEAADAGDTAPKTPPSEAERRRELTEHVVNESKLLLALIGTRGANSNGDRVADLLGDSDFAGQSLKDALSGVNGVDLASAGDGPRIRNGSGEGRVEDADIGDLRRAKEGTSTVGDGPTTQVVGIVKPEDDGSLLPEGDPGQIQDIVRRQSGQVLYCYERYLKLDPTLSGRVEVGWTISKGRVVRASILSNTTANDEFGRCVADKVRLWRFPEDIQGEVIYPFVVTPSN